MTVIFAATDSIAAARAELVRVAAAAVEISEELPSCLAEHEASLYCILQEMFRMDATYAKQSNTPPQKARPASDSPFGSLKGRYLF